MARAGDARWAGCSSNLCTPGKPRAEQCNDFDDDCDGVADNGTDLELCGKPGFVCRAGECLVAPKDEPESAKSSVAMMIPTGDDGFIFSSERERDGRVQRQPLARSSTSRGAMLLLLGLGSPSPG